MLPGLASTLQFRTPGGPSRPTPRAPPPEGRLERQELTRLAAAKSPPPAATESRPDPEGATWTEPRGTPPRRPAVAHGQLEVRSSMRRRGQNSPAATVRRLGQGDQRPQICPSVRRTADELELGGRRHGRRNTPRGKTLDRAQLPRHLLLPASRAHSRSSKAKTPAASTPALPTRTNRARQLPHAEPDQQLGLSAAEVSEHAKGCRAVR
jgi:hypothetical protein